MCGLTEQEIGELVDYGSLREPDDGFPREIVGPLREAQRVRALFDLELFSAGLLLQYLRRIDQLESELRMLRGRVSAPHGLREEPATWHEPHA